MTDHVGSYLQRKCAVGVFGVIALCSLISGCRGGDAASGAVVDAGTEAALSRQQAFVERGGFLTSQTGEAIHDYADAMAALKQVDISTNQLEPGNAADAAVAAKTLQQLKRVVQYVCQGASRQQLGLPSSGWFTKKMNPGMKDQTRVNLGSGTLEIYDFRWLISACSIVARHSQRDGDDSQTLRIARAMMAMGLQITLQSDDMVVQAIGLSCKRASVDLLGDIAKATDDPEIRAVHQFMSQDVQKEFDCLLQATERR